LKQPTKRLTLANLGDAPDVVLSAEPTDEELRQAIKEKVIATLRRGKDSKWTREDWDLIKEFWARIEPKNAPREDEKMSAADAKKIADIYERIFGRTEAMNCPHCGKTLETTA